MDLGEGEMKSYCLMGTESQIGKKKVLERDGGDGCATAKMY